MKDFLNIDYLSQGNEKQKLLYRVLTEHNILKRISDYSPIVVGTIPIEIDIDDSDVDIVCCFKDKEKFKEMLLNSFSSYNGFSLNDYHEKDTITCNFEIELLKFEIYGSDVESTKQYGYLHMLKEAELLDFYGKDLRDRIIFLKQSGLKTEPAFCKDLGIDGNPYEELLKFKI